MRVTVRRRSYADPLRNLTGPKTVRVGFPASESARDIVDRAIWNHYGTEHIPPRPFVLNAVRGNRNKYRRLLMASASRLIREEGDLRTEMNQLGGVAQGDIQQEIVDLRDPPNAARTIAAKGSSNPLIDTGEMRQAVTWEVQ